MWGGGGGGVMECTSKFHWGFLRWKNHVVASPQESWLQQSWATHSPSTFQTLLAYLQTFSMRLSYCCGIFNMCMALSCFSASKVGQFLIIRVTFCHGHTVFKKKKTGTFAGIYYQCYFTEMEDSATVPAIKRLQILFCYYNDVLQKLIWGCLAGSGWEALTLTFFGYCFTQERAWVPFSPSLGWALYSVS